MIALLAHVEHERRRLEPMASHVRHASSDDSDQSSKSGLAIVCQVRARHCALLVSRIVETMRPLPVEPLASMPPFVAGLAVIRGTPTPVIDAGALLGESAAARPTRFVVVRIGARHVALAVEGVLGVRSLDATALLELPPLLRHASNEIVSALGTLDAELLVVLGDAYLIPPSLWEQLDTARAAP
jgi:purine-binding chemotaxis protein CheW